MLVGYVALFFVLQNTDCSHEEKIILHKNCGEMFDVYTLKLKVDSIFQIMLPGQT